MLLGGVEQKIEGVAVEQKAVPDADEPGIPREDCRWLPVSEAEGELLQVELAMQGARGALVGSDDGPALLQRLLNLPEQRVRTVHTPFIRRAGAENAAAAS